MDDSKAILTDAQLMCIAITASDSLKITRFHEIGGPSRTTMEDEGLLELARAIEQATIEAYERQRESADATFDLWQHDMVVASASGPRDKALAEIKHYAALYSQEGPVQVEEVIRIPLDAP